MKVNESFQKSGIRRCWFIRVIDEVFLEIKEQQKLLKKKDPRTFDFPTMYTCLQHQLIKKNVRIAVEEAVKYAQCLERQQMPHTSSQFEKCGGYHGTREFYS